MLAVALSSTAFMGPAPLAHSKVSLSKISMGGKGFGGGEATRDPAPTYVDPNDPKGKQQAIHKAESFAEYLARRAGGGGAAPAAPEAAAPSAPAPMHGGKGFGGGEATRDPAPTVIDPNDPKGKQQAIHKAESFAEYLARRSGGGDAAAPAAAAPAAASGGGGGGDIGSTLATLQGPEIFWGPEGPLQDPMKEESDLKEYDTFSKFIAACAANGVDLTQPGITVLAPANLACTEFEATGATLTKDICAYHIIKGEYNTDALSSADLTTVQGSKITYRRMFRKDFLDNAMCGVKSAPPRSSYCSNVKASNGFIHGINEVIYPGWSESAGMSPTA